MELEVDDLVCRQPMIRQEMWHIMTPPPVDMRMGDAPAKPHFGRFGPGGQLRIALQFIPDGASARRRTPSGPPSEWQRRGRRQDDREEEERRRRKRNGAEAEDHLDDGDGSKDKTGAANDRPVALECLVACMQSEEPGESTIALATFLQLCHGGGGASGVMNRERLIGAGCLELLLPLCFDSTCEMEEEPPASDVLEALKSDVLRDAFVSAPLSCDDKVFVTSLAALVGLAGPPSRRRTELVDITTSLSDLADTVRKDLLFMLARGSDVGPVDWYLKKTRNKEQLEKDDKEFEREGPSGWRLLCMGAMPFVLRFLLMGETLGEDPENIEEAYGGFLTVDQFVRTHGNPIDEGRRGGRDGRDRLRRKENEDAGGMDLFERRTERRRVASIILHRLMLASSIGCPSVPGVVTMTAKEVSTSVYLPSVVSFLTMVTQENQLARLSGEARLLLGTEGRDIFHMSTEASMLALVNIARLNPEGGLQPRARYDVASTILTTSALHVSLLLCSSFFVLLSFCFSFADFSFFFFFFFPSSFFLLRSFFFSALLRTLLDYQSYLLRLRSPMRLTQALLQKLTTTTAGKFDLPLLPFVFSSLVFLVSIKREVFLMNKLSRSKHCELLSTRRQMERS